MNTDGYLIKRRGYIYFAVKGHRDTIFTAAVQSLDGTKPNTNPKTNPNPSDGQITNQILFCVKFLSFDLIHTIKIFCNACQI